jgi:Nif-specific regulatory protein
MPVPAPEPGPGVLFRPAAPAPAPAAPSADGPAAAAPGVEWLLDQERLLLVEATRRLTRCLEPARVIREMLQLASELIGLNRGRVVLPDAADATGRTLVIAHCYGLTREEAARGRYAWGEGITGQVMATGIEAIVQDVDADAGFLCRAVGRATLPEGTVSYLAVPVMGAHGQLGVLGVHRLRARSRPLARDLTVLNALAALIGQVLQVNRFVADRTAVLEQENHRLRHALHAHQAHQANPAGIVGNAPRLRQALHQIEQVAAADVTVLLLGESGTGKELFARALHLHSPRRGGPFVKINCGAIPEALFESELFGHERGAFTGASQARAGRFEQAHGGTLFLDEIGDLPMAMQVKLLRVLQERCVQRLGGEGREIAVDVRLVAATHHDLHRLVEAGRFRADLMYRLNVIPVQLPALRERRGDMPELVRHFVSRLNQEHQRNAVVGPGAMASLCAYEWPGNIRQLANVLERLVLLSGDAAIGSEMVARALGDEAIRGVPPPATPPAVGSVAVRPYEWVRGEDRQRLEAAVRAAGGNRAQAARALGMTPRQLGYRLKVMGIGAPDKA